MDKFTALMDRDDFLGTAEERDLDARINALARVIAVTPALTAVAAAIKRAALLRWNGKISAFDLKEEIAAELAAAYIMDVTALVEKGAAEIVASAA